MSTAIRLALQVGCVASACFGNVSEPTTSAFPPPGWTPAIDTAIRERHLTGVTPSPGPSLRRPGAMPSDFPQTPLWSAQAPPQDPDGPIDPAGCADCVSGDLIEGEPNCADLYIDAFNGGCNSTPNVFGQFIECGQSICGKYGTYVSSTGSNFRDTDWYRFTIPVASDVTWTATGSAPTRVFILNAVCPAVSRGTAGAPACVPASVTLTALPAGTYYAFVGTDVFTGVACGSSYRATLMATPCCQTAPQPGDIIEDEPDCAANYVDAYNGGCNSTPNVFSFIQCGQTVAGRYGTFLNGASNFRDTDWYQFTITATSDVRWTAVGEAATRVFIMNGSCPAVSLGTTSAAACNPATVSLLGLAPGTYYAFVGTDAFTGVPCGSRYRATLQTSTCCIPAIEPGDIIENEPACGPAYVDVFNGGCNSTPPVFSSIGCGQSVAGEYGTFLNAAGGSTRDTDWYQFTLATASDVTWSAIGEARTRVFIINGTCPATIVATAVADSCAPATASVTALAAGTYYAFVATDAFTGVPCRSRYRATLQTAACCSVPPQTGDIPENESLCFDGSSDSFNGGCNSNPEIYGSIECGQTIAGHYGTFLNGATNTRDTDWYTFVVDQAAAVTWTVNGESASFIAIVNDICPATVVVSASSAGPCVPVSVSANLNPGTYRAFVATRTFTGTPCTARYRATLRSSPCGCAADFNGDGVVDFFDYLDFVQAFAAQIPAADFNGDGVIDFFDYLDFVQAFSAGC